VIPLAQSKNIVLVCQTKEFLVFATAAEVGCAAAPAPIGKSLGSQ